MTTTPSIITGISDNHLGSDITIYIRRSSDAYRHKLFYSFGSTEYEITERNGKNFIFTPRCNEIMDFPDTNYGTAVFTLETYSNSSYTNKIGTTTKEFKLYLPRDYYPHLQNWSISIDNSDIPNPEKFIKNDEMIGIVGYSKVYYTATPISCFGSPIKEYEFTGDYKAIISKEEAEQNGEAEGLMGYLTPEPIDTAGEHWYGFKCIDNRGYESNSPSNILFFHPYRNPSINFFDVQRSSKSTRDIIITLNYSISYIDGLNSAKALLYYKKSTNNNWNPNPIELIEITTNNSDDELIITKGQKVTNNTVSTAITIDTNLQDFITNFDETSSYDFRIAVTDDLNNEVYADAKISTITVLMDFKAGGRGVAFGKIAELDGLEVALPFYPQNGIYANVLINNINLNNITIPGIYKGKTSQVVNSPINNDLPFSLEVLEFGGKDSKDIFQRITILSNGNRQVFERTYIVETINISTWTDWECTIDTRYPLLWTGMYYMHAPNNSPQIVELSEPISKQANGIELVFAPYNAETKSIKPGNWEIRQIPKSFVKNHYGERTCFVLTEDRFNSISKKWLIVRDEELEGIEANSASGENSGISYNNARFVLTEVRGY